MSPSFAALHALVSRQIDSVSLIRRVARCPILLICSHSFSTHSSYSGKNSTPSFSNDLIETGFYPRSIGEARWFQATSTFLSGL